MTRPDTVFAHFVDANPVPDESVTPETIPSLDLHRPVLATVTSLPHRPVRRGALVAVAAFAVVLIVGIALALTSLRSSEPEPVDPEELLVQEASAAIEDLYAAIGAGDTNRVIDRLAEHERTVARVNGYEWQSAFSASGLAHTIEECELAAVSRTRVEGRCTILLNDPVADELGAGRQVRRYTYDAGLAHRVELRGRQHPRRQRRLLGVRAHIPRGSVSGCVPAQCLRARHLLPERAAGAHRRLRRAGRPARRRGRRVDPGGGVRTRDLDHGRLS